MMELLEETTSSRGNWDFPWDSLKHGQRSSRVKKCHLDKGVNTTLSDDDAKSIPQV